MERLQRGRHSAVLTVRASAVLEGTRTGDSIAVNGVCLTVTALSGRGFSADVMHETLDRSTLAGLSPGARVDLERAMAAGGRFGGHLVAGHVDGVGRIVRVRRDDTALWYTVAAGPELLRYVVEKGSVAIDGISLTVAAVTDRDFSVSVIPHTAAESVLGERVPGDLVNLEADMIGKYVEKLLAPAPAGRTEGGVTRDLLSRCGF